ncbi:integrase core domain-containing protein [Gallibacterium genomosp. 1]|uniref:integrase core domain-containing protein n=1 Tax=Gallibacterium TaxID=155493 RepID=UPI00057F4EE6
MQNLSNKITNINNDLQSDPLQKILYVLSYFHCFCTKVVTKKSQNQKLAEWEAFYNYARPHSAIGGKTPYERLLEKIK